MITIEMKLKLKVLTLFAIWKIQRIILNENVQGSKYLPLHLLKHITFEAILNELGF